MHHFNSSFSCFSHTGGKLFRSTVMVRSASPRISLFTIFDENNVNRTAFATTPESIPTASGKRHLASGRCIFQRRNMKTSCPDPVLNGNYIAIQ